MSRYKTKLGIKKECRDTRVENIDTLASTSDFPNSSIHTSVHAPPFLLVKSPQPSPSPEDVMENKIPVTRTAQGLGIPPLQEEDERPIGLTSPMDGIFFFSF